MYSAGELNSDELERIVTIIQNPTQFKIPTWFLNRQRDIVDGKNSQILSNGVDSKLRDDLERLKKIRAHRGLRHFWGLRVRGQHTKTTGMCIWICNVMMVAHVYGQAVGARPSVCRRSAVKRFWRISCFRCTISLSAAVSCSLCDVSFPCSNANHYDMPSFLVFLCVLLVLVAFGSGVLA